MPSDSPFLTARWIQLVMLNYETDPSILHARLPPGTELDSYRGRTFLSVVGFRLADTRVLGIPIPFHRNFDEVNLRFYVRRNVDGQVRRGVVFVKEIVPRRAIAWFARVLYNENYVSMPMSHFDESDLRQDPRIAYAWKSPSGMSSMQVRATGSPFIPDETSEESFITEHYWGYVVQRDGSSLEYEVRHPRWSVRRTSEAKLACDVGKFYGPEFEPFLHEVPHSAFVAGGSAISVHRGKRIL